MDSATEVAAETVMETQAKEILSVIDSSSRQVIELENRIGAVLYQGGSSEITESPTADMPTQAQCTFADIQDAANKLYKQISVVLNRIQV